MNAIIAIILNTIIGALFKRFDEPTFDFKEAASEKIIPSNDIFDNYDWVPKD